MPIPRAVAHFNRVVTNPLQQLWAGRLPGFAIVEHTGRRSGTTHRTPVNAFRTSDGFAIALTYGAESDWVRNVLTAGGGHLEHRGRRIRVEDPRIERGPKALEILPRAARIAQRLLDVDQVLILRVPDSPEDG